MELKKSGFTVELFFMSSQFLKQLEDKQSIKAVVSRQFFSSVKL